MKKRNYTNAGLGLALIGGGALLTVAAFVAPLIASAQEATTTPIISSVVATPTDTTATITWNTDVSSNSQVEYGTTTSYGTFSALDSTEGTAHNIVLSGLAPDTTYHLAVLSQTGSSSQAVSPDQTFTTMISNASTTATSTAPNISSILVTPTDTGATITWTTDVPATTQVSYGTSAGTYTGSSTLDSSLGTSHSATLSSLTPDTQYHFVVMSNNSSGTNSTSNDETFMTNMSGTASSTPTITLGASSGAEGTTVNVSGSGFNPSEGITLSFGGNTSTTTADTNGNFSTTLTVPNQSGAVTISATGNTSGLSANSTFTIGTSGTTSTSTQDIITKIDSLWTQLQSLISQLNSATGGSAGATIWNVSGVGTTTTTGTSGTGATPSIDQQGQTFSAGGTVDFSGRNFDHEQNVTVMMNGQQVATAHADGGGNFSTGSLTVPSTPGTYTYLFTDPGGASANATITVQ